MREPLVIIAGPTAVGKSAAAVDLAKCINGEVISADSMQVYRSMDIGTAKVSRQEMQGIPHHLIDIREPEEDFNITLFQELADKAIKDIRARGRLPIICGGTGFYIQSILYGIEFTEEDSDLSYRRELEEICRSRGPEPLVEDLKMKDPDSFLYFHENNIKKVIRALEFYHTTGRKMSEHNKEQRAREPVYHAAFFVLTDDRERLYRRIDERVDDMFKQGLVAEVEALKNKGIRREAVSMQGIGYKEVYDALAGDCTMEEAAERIKQGSRHYAKRQLTWFRRERDVIWLDRSAMEDPGRDIREKMLKVLKERGIFG